MFKAPDGNGGCLLALKNHGIIDECLKRGVEYINIMAIDNPLYKIMDPLFIGTTISKGKNGKEQMGAKYIKKVDPEQKVGYFLAISAIEASPIVAASRKTIFISCKG